MRDDWPPNYGGGGGYADGFESWNSGKHVCLKCRIAFRVSVYKKVERGEVKESTVTITEIAPLIERNGWLLTPHDMWRLMIKDETGEWPDEAYG